VQTALEAESIVIYPRSFGTQWTQAERDQNVAYFDDLLAHVKANYCIDERRVYAVGTSSGAHFANVLACRRGDDLLAVVPGAGERLEKENCVGRVAALVLHGVADMVSVPFSKGEEARDEYAAQNECSGETVPPLATMHETVSAARAANMPTSGCVDYQGCREGLPVRWCEHSEPGYDGTTHGFPTVGGPLAWEFIRDL
jgi:poly(3-hydroxybutyrate) depolymerase